MTGPAERDALAAEYVLGTLDAAERAVIAARMRTEPELSVAIADWEARLAPLSQLVEPVAPPPELAKKIEQKLAAATLGAITPGELPQPASLVNLDTERRLRRWRGIGIGMSALAATLALFIGVREVARPVATQNFVAVFQKDDASPSFVMSVDLATRTLSVKRVAADVPAGKTYQLWIASDKLGVGPQSLGLVEQGSDVKQAISRIDPGIVQNALFGVSLEPAGGSPTGKPTGPVFHAKLIPTSP
jgi:anti-sigma-K factor RskA